MTAGRLSTVYCGVRVNMDFKGGNPSAGMKASLCTDNPFAQDAIEHDPRFGGDIKLYRSFDGDEKEIPPSKAAVKKVNKVKNANDAVAYFTELGETVESDGDIEALCVKHNVAFPNMK